MKFRIVFWDVLPCKIIVDRRFRGSLMMEAVRTSETSVDNYFTRQYIPEDNSELNIFPVPPYSSFMSVLFADTSFGSKKAVFNYTLLLKVYMAFSPSQ
jgi:hypothetical protein